MSSRAAGLAVAVAEVDVDADVSVGKSDPCAMLLNQRAPAMSATTANTAQRMSTGLAGVRRRSVGVTLIGSSKLLRNPGGRAGALGTGGAVGARRGVSAAADEAAAANSRAEP